MKNHSAQLLINSYVGVLVLIGLGATLSTYFIPEPYLSQGLNFFYGQEYVTQGLATIQKNPVHEHPHRILGVLFILSGLVQFSNTIRNRSRMFHKLAGYTFISCALLVAVGGMIMGFIIPFAGTGESYGFLLFGLIVLTSTYFGWQKIRERDFTGHQHWMIRVYMMSLSTLALRFYALPLIKLTDIATVDLFMYAFWAGFVTNVLVAEAWIKTIRKDSEKKPAKRVLQTA